MNSLGTLFYKIGANTTDLEAKLKQSTKSFQKMTDGFTQIGKSLTIGVTAPLTALGAASLKSAADLEALERGLTAVMGSAAAAEKEMENLRQVAKLPGLGLEEAAKGSVSLQSAGFSADKARDSLMAFGNALATVGRGRKDMDGVILALTQLQQKSTGYGQDLRQLVERLPQVRSALENAFGTSSTDEISRFGVTGEQVIDALIAEFSKLPPITSGLKNAFENFSDSTTMALATVGESINKALNVEEIVIKLSNAIENVADTFSKLNPVIQKSIIVFGVIVSAIGPLLLVLGALGSAVPLITTAIGVLGAAFSTLGVVINTSLLPITAIIVGLAGVAAGVIYVRQNFDAFKNVAQRVFKQVEISVTGFVGAAYEQFAKLFRFIGMEGQASSFEKFAEQSASKVGMLEEQLSDLVGNQPEFMGFKETWQSFTKDLKDFIFPAEQAADAMEEIANKGAAAKSSLDSFLTRPFVPAQPFFQGTDPSQFLQGPLPGAQPEMGPNNFEYIFTDGAITGIRYFGEETEKVTENLGGARNVASQLVNVFSSLASENPFEALKQAITQMIVQLAKAVGMAVILSALFPGATGGKAFGGILKGILGFAEGGIVTGPTLGLIGEKPGSRGEAVIPLEKMGSVMGSLGGMGMGGGRLTASVSGTDLKFILDRTNQNFNRFN